MRVWLAATFMASALALSTVASAQEVDDAPTASESLGAQAEKLVGHPVKNDRELSDLLAASSDESDRNLGYFIRFVTDGATLSGAVKTCDMREYRIYMQCAATIIANWKALENHDLPNVSSDTKSSTQVTDDLWKKQEDSMKKKIGNPSSEQCFDIISRERKSRIWSVCNRDDIEAASGVAPSEDDYSVNKTLK